jgi:hypothetical protein
MNPSQRINNFYAFVLFHDGVRFLAIVGKKLCEVSHKNLTEAIDNNANVELYLVER